MRTRGAQKAPTTTDPNQVFPGPHRLQKAERDSFVSRACPHPFPVATATPVGHPLSYQEEILDSRRRLEPFFAPEQAGTAFAATSRVSSTVTGHGSGHLNYEQDRKLLLCCIASRLRPTGRVDGFCDKFAWPFYAVVSFQVPILTLLPMQMTLVMSLMQHTTFNP